MITKPGFKLATWTNLHDYLMIKKDDFKKWRSYTQKHCAPDILLSQSSLFVQAAISNGQRSSAVNPTSLHPLDVPLH